MLTGIGMVTPIGNTREETWDSVVAGRSGGAPITIFPLRDAPVRFACEVKDFEPTVAMDRKLARRTDRYTPVRARRRARGDRGRGPRRDRGRARRAHGYGRGDGHRRAADARPRPRAPLLEGHRPHEPALDHDADPEHGRRDGLDGVRLPRPVEHRHDGLRRLLDGDRRCRRHHPRRPRGRHGRGRQRGADHAHRRRRVLRHARHLAAQRRSRDGQPAVRRRARRLRDRRGLDDRRARGARARPGARRAASTARSWATAARPTRITSPSPTRPASTRRARCGWRWRRPAWTRARSATSTRTAPRRPSATAPRRA